MPTSNRAGQNERLVQDSRERVAVETNRREQPTRGARETPTPPINTSARNISGTWDFLNHGIPPQQTPEAEEDGAENTDEYIAIPRTPGRNRPRESAFRYENIETSPTPPPQQHAPGTDPILSADALKERGFPQSYIDILLEPGTNRTHAYPTHINNHRTDNHRIALSNRSGGFRSNDLPLKDFTHTPDYRVFVSVKPKTRIITKKTRLPDFKRYILNKNRRALPKDVSSVYKKKGVDTFTCHICKGEHPAIKNRMYNTIYGFLVCSSCAEYVTFTTCETCKKLYYNPQFKMSVFDNGIQAYLCPDCAKAETSTSSTCGLCGFIQPKKVKMIDTRPINNYNDIEFICEGCYYSNFTRCSDCGKAVFKNNSYTVHDYKYCQTCYDKRYKTCQYCGQAISRDYIATEEAHLESIDNPDYIKPHGVKLKNNIYACISCYTRQLSPVKTYNYIPHFQHHTAQTDKKTNLRFGIELEIENKKRTTTNSQLAENITKLFNFVYCVHDGSLNNGFEIVTHPFTYTYLKEHINDFKRLLSYIKTKGYVSYQPGTCGIHIHMSRKAFTTCHMYKFIKLFYEPKNFKFLRTISQRDDRSCSEGCQWGRKREVSYSSDADYTAKGKTKHCSVGSKYTAVNTKHPDTLEIRIFRGTLSFNSYIKNIEFCMSLYKFSRDTALDNVTVPEFINFIIEHKKNYKHLYNFLVDVTLVTGKRVKFNKNYTRKTKEI